MTRDEYLAMLDTEPATGPQIGVIIAEFARLGVDDRAERLAISAALLELGELRSTCDLVMGQAGRLIRMLRDVGDRAGLPDVTSAAAADDGQAGAETGMSAVAAIRQLVLAIAIAVRCGGSDGLVLAGPVRPPEPRAGQRA